MAGGMVVFLESDDNEKLIDFYEGKNGFKCFAVKEIKSGTENVHKLIQFLKVL